MHSGSFIALLLGLSALCLLSASGAAAEFDSPSAFSSELRRLNSSLAGESGQRVLSGLPSHWVIRTEEATYSIPSRPPSARSVSVAEEQQWIIALADQAEHYLASPPIGRKSARPALDAILRRPEFEKEKPPSEWEQLQTRIARWIASQFQQLIAAIARNPGASLTLFWVLVPAAVSLIAVFLRRWMQSRKSRLRLTGTPTRLTGPADWQQLLSDAHVAAIAGDLRRAIQLAYWGAIARLQDLNSLPRIGAHTPREYLRLLPEEDAARGPLRSLTGQLEKFWYAGSAPVPADFETTRKSLQEIGCPLA